jgi:Spy/CpxP family protein refolding chaperone
MNKVLTLVALLGLTVYSVAMAADTKTETSSSSSSNTDSTTGNKSANPPHEHIENMRAVTSLSSLTDKQKQQINAIYEKNKPQYDSLQKQVRTLRESEWSQVKPLLTPGQLIELRNNRPKHHRGRGDASAADAQDAPTEQANK